MFLAFVERDVARPSLGGVSAILLGCVLDSLHVFVCEDDGLCTHALEELLARLYHVSHAETVEHKAVLLQLVFLAPDSQHLFSNLLVFTPLATQDDLDLAARLGGSGELHPVGFHAHVLGGEDFHLVAALEHVVDGNELVVDLGTHAMRAHDGMYAEGKVQCRAACGHGAELALGRDDQNLGAVEVELDGGQEVHGRGLWVIQDFLDGGEPLLQLCLAGCGVLGSLLVFPVGGEATFCHVVHAPGTDLQFYPPSLWAHECGVEGPVAIGLGCGEPVAEAVWVCLVDACACGVDLEAVCHLSVLGMGVEDDAHSQQVVDFLEAHMLIPHLGPDTVGALDACIDVIGQSHAVEFLADRLDEALEHVVEVGSQLVESCADVGVGLGVFILEAEVFQFFLDEIKSEPMRQRGIDIQGLTGNLVLLVWRLRAQCAHIVETVADFDEYDTDVIAHGQQQFLERLGLCRCLVAEDATGDLGESIDNLCNLLAEDVADVLHRVVCVLHHIVQQSSADAGTAQPYLAADDLRHGQRVGDIGLTG